MPEKHPVFENILTYRNFGCDDFSRVKQDELEKIVVRSQPHAHQSASMPSASARIVANEMWPAWRLTMGSAAFPLMSDLPVAIVGAGPVGLTTALALAYYQIPFIVFEANAGLSTETKAGTTLTRTLEIWQRFGAASKVLAKAMRVDEIGDIERATNRSRNSGQASSAARRDPFPVRHQPAAARHGAGAARLPGAADSGKILYRHRLTSFMQHPDQVTLELDTPDGNKTFEACYLLGCDGGRSTVRDRLGVTVEGRSLPERYSAGRSQGRSRRREPSRLSLSGLFQRRPGMDDPRPPAGVLALPLSGVRRTERIFDRRIAREGRAFHRRRLERRSAGHQSVQDLPPRRAEMAPRPGRCCSATPPT